MGLFGGTQIEKNVIAWIGLTELQIAIRSRYCFRRPKVKRIEKNSNTGSGCLFVRLYDIVNIHANADMAK